MISTEILVFFAFHNNNPSFRQIGCFILLLSIDNESTYQFYLLTISSLGKIESLWAFLTVTQYQSSFVLGIQPKLFEY